VSRLEYYGFQLPAYIFMEFCLSNQAQTEIRLATLPHVIR